MKKFIIKKLLLLLFVSSLSAKDFKPNEYSRELRDFAVDVVFSHEIRGTNIFVPFRQKVSIYVQADDQVKSKVMKDLKRLAKLTNFEIVESEKPSHNNTGGITHLNIYVDDLKEIKDIARSLGDRLRSHHLSLYYFRSIKNVNEEDDTVFYDVKNANIYVSTEVEDINERVIRLYLGAIGFPAHSSEISGFYFSNKQAKKELTVFDKWLVSFVYTHFRAGQDKRDLKKLIKEEWEKFTANAKV